MSDQAENLRKKIKQSDPRYNFEKVVCIGTSTGGPGALGRVLVKLPENFSAPLLIVQHMPPSFTKSLAERLNTLTKIHVKEAVDGEMIEKGKAYIAPGNFHMKVKQAESGIVVELDQSVPKEGHRPSANELFTSVAALTGCEKIAVIMTGMGSDGTEGLHVLKTSGNTFAIAESKESAVVFGMPRAAVDTGMIDDVIHVDHIADRLIEKIERR